MSDGIAMRLARAALVVTGIGLAVATGGAQSSPSTGQCVDYSNDPAGCQPSTFRTPLESIPLGRINKDGKDDPKASEQDVRAGVAHLEKKLHLFRNFDHLHWVAMLPSEKDAATGGWKGGDLDGAGAERSFTIAGNCIFVGHAPAAGVLRPMTVLKIQPNPEKQPPVVVGGIPTAVEGGTRRGVDDKEARARAYEIAPGQERMILVRLTDDVLQSYRIDVNTCLPVSNSEQYEMVGGPHEFFLWQDPQNSKRLLVYMTMFGGGVPDPADPSRTVPDAYVLAVTDETTGDVLAKPSLVASFSLSDVGGPPANERPDPTGLYSDGRFADFSHLKTSEGDAGEYTTRQGNHLHSLSVSDDGERVYAAGGPAGFYVLSAEFIARNRNAALAAGTAGCNLRSTPVVANGVFDPSKVGAVANDCLHMVVNDDPGLKAFLASSASAQVKAQRYLVLVTRSRLDVHPPFNALVTGIHSAVFVPNRPAQVKDNPKNRPAYVFLTDENFGCPSMYARIASVEVESTPAMVGAFTLPHQDLKGCLERSTTGPNGQTRALDSQQSHNPTVFANLVFLGWLTHGVRVLDISQPQTPREVGHALTVPGWAKARGYPVFKDGLMYWHAIGNGLHVARYTGPRANEIPKSGIYDSNSTSPHR